MAAGKPVAYEELLIPLFVQGYLIVMRGEKEAVRAKMASHLEELMGESTLYSCERVRAYHGVWINQLEQGQASWENEEEKVRFRCALISHLATSASAAPFTSAASGTQKQPF